MPYPEWKFYPSWSARPGWIYQVVEVVANAQTLIDSNALIGDSALRSNPVLSVLKPGLAGIGFDVETPENKLVRPVLFGERDTFEKRFDIDGWHDVYNIALEVEAGKAWESKAALYDFIKMTLIVDAQFGVIIIPQNYERGSRYAAPYANQRALFDAMYANPGRLSFALEGLLLIGY